MKRFFLLLLFMATSCFSDFKKGESAFEIKDYSTAKDHYRLVKRSDENYDLAQIRLKDIAEFESEKLFNKALDALTSENYDQAKEGFDQIKEGSGFYQKSRYHLSKIDSLKQVKKKRDEELARKQQIELRKLEIVKRKEEERALIKIKKEVKILFNELMSFKDKSDFHYYGFAVGYKYNKWLLKIKELKSTPEDYILLIRQGFGVGDLEMLGLEYVGTRGGETEYSIWAKKKIQDGLKSPPWWGD